MKPMTLTREERAKLEMLRRRRKMAHWLAIRAQMVLLSADGMSNVEVAEHLYVHPNTVGKWRERFRVRRLAGLLDEPRPGAPRTILDDKVEDIFGKIHRLCTGISRTGQ